MTNKHTKAPWQLTSSPTTDPDAMAITNREVYIAELYCLGEHYSQAEPGEVKANAQLIAAAPELLKAAKTAKILCDLICKWADADQHDSFAIMDDIVCIADDRQPAQAIKKATGG